MKVSVIIPAYNLQEYIIDCLISVLNQKVDFEYEVICIDDYSSDNTWLQMNRIKSDYSQLRLFRNEVNLGLAKTQKRLLSLVKGKLIAYMDGDDIALPGKLKALAGHMDSNLGCNLSYHEAEVFDSKTGGILGYYSQDFYNASAIPEEANISHLIQYGSFFNASSFMFRRHENILSTIDERCKIILDYPWHILNMLYLGGSIDFINEVYGRYRVHDGSFGGQTREFPMRRIQCMQDQLIAVENARKFNIEKIIIEKGIAHNYFSAALFFLKQNMPLLFIKYIELASVNEIYFDNRHKLAYEFRQDPGYVMTQLFGLSENEKNIT